MDCSLLEPCAVQAACLLMSVMVKEATQRHTAVAISSALLHVLLSNQKALEGLASFETLVAPSLCPTISSGHLAQEMLAKHFVDSETHTLADGTRDLRRCLGNHPIHRNLQEVNNAASNVRHHEATVNCKLLRDLEAALKHKDVGYLPAGRRRRVTSSL